MRERAFAVALLLWLGLTLATPPAAAQEPAVQPVTPAGSAGLPLSDYYDRIFQIRVVARNAGSKSSIGSGFQVTADGLVVTNYHVVSAAVNSPDSHRVEYRDHTGASGELELLDFDVVHDLALLRHPEPAAGYFEISADPVRRGDVIYALGNPRDFGITLKDGAYNGMVEHSYNPQILFSGSLNPGMSGGPGLLRDGRVIGVNVATAGSDLSFLVPASELLRLIARQRALAPQDYTAEIASQIAAWQQQRFADLLDRDWPAADLDGEPALGELRRDMQCWGKSNEEDEDITLVVISKGCNAGNRIYLDRGFNTGQIHYSFTRKSARGLNPWRFHNALNGTAGPDNRADRTQVANYQCESSFIDLPPPEPQSEPAPGRSTLAHLCVRAYVDMPGLFDVLWLAERSGNQHAYSVHFTLAGVPRAEAMAFTDKFLAAIAWKP